MYTFPKISSYTSVRSHPISSRCNRYTHLFKYSHVSPFLHVSLTWKWLKLPAYDVFNLSWRHSWQSPHQTDFFDNRIAEPDKDVSVCHLEILYRDQMFTACEIPPIVGTAVKGSTPSYIPLYLVLFLFNFAQRLLYNIFTKSFDVEVCKFYIVKCIEKRCIQIYTSLRMTACTCDGLPLFKIPLLKS